MKCNLCFKEIESTGNCGCQEFTYPDMNKAQESAIEMVIRLEAENKTLKLAMKEAMGFVKEWQCDCMYIQDLKLVCDKHKLEKKVEEILK